jgi:16S rRNA processing protein RimM
MPQSRILVGHIGAASGLKGEVKIASFTENPLAIADYGAVEIDGSPRRLVITSIRRAKSGVIARFEGVANRSEAERLKGSRLYVPRERLPRLKSGSYYHADLIGLEVRAGQKSLGIVRSVVNYGAGDLLNVEAREGEEGILVPFRGAKVDLGRKKIEVELAEGFLEGLGGTDNARRSHGRA